MVHPPRRGECGSQAVEFTILAPVLLLVIGVLIVGGRIALAGNALESAAVSAAREATLAGAGEAARERAAVAAREWMERAGHPCAALSAVVTEQAAQGHSPALTHVTISCSLDMGDLALPGLERARQLEASATSPADAFKERP